MIGQIKLRSVLPVVDISLFAHPIVNTSASLAIVRCAPAPLRYRLNSSTAASAAADYHM